MHALLLTLIALGGGAEGYASGRITQSSADIYSAGAMNGGCDTCGAGGCGGHGAKGFNTFLGHMPQTCYSPRYGCYFGNNRYMARYPAFHGNFYRRPYVYRDVFDYPWHAEMHEPTSLFSYNVIGEEGRGGPANPPIPTPSAPFDSARRMQRAAQGVTSPGDPAAISAMRRAAPPGMYKRDMTDPNVTPAATLRR